jgi:hypothetical protein
MLAVSSFFSKGSGKRAGCLTKRAQMKWEVKGLAGIDIRVPPREIKTRTAFLKSAVPVSFGG